MQEFQEMQYILNKYFSVGCAAQYKDKFNFDIMI